MLRCHFVPALHLICIPAAAAIVAVPLALGQQFQDQTTTRFPQPSLLEYTNQIGIVDVDGDTDLDIAFANGGGFPSAGPDEQVRLFINDGTGVFTDESIARIGELLGDFRGVEFGDVERDGDWDMVLTNDNNQLPRLLINDGKGNFTDETATRLPNLTLGGSRVQFGDVDNDGDLDLYFTNGTTSRVGVGRGKLYLNNGSGVYNDATLTNTPNQNVTEPQDCIFGDVDGDFDLDLRIGSTASNQSKLYRNNGAGVFTQLSTPSDNNCKSYDFGDINNDGDFDLLGINAHNVSTNAELLLNNSNSTGTYTVHTWTGSTIDDNDSKFFDYDNDGDLDIFIASLGANERVYTNNGANPPGYSLAAGVVQPIADSSLDIKVADFDGDGRYDLVTAQGESGSFIDRIYMNVSGPVDDRAPVIKGTEQLPTAVTAGPFAVRTVVYDAHTSDRGFHDKGVMLNYQVQGIAGVQQVPMAWSGNSLWRGSIPAQTGSATISYFITATDFANNTATGPVKTLVINLPCPADVNDNNVVDVDDLLSVINNWGQTSTTHTINVQDFEFVPPSLDARSGDTIQFQWVNGLHTATSGSGCVGDGKFNQPLSAGNPTFNYTIPASFTGPIPYFCVPHCGDAMTGAVTVASFVGDVDGNGAVDVNDLLGVINGWGECP